MVNDRDRNAAENLNRPAWPEFTPVDMTVPGMFPEEIPCPQETPQPAWMKPEAQEAV